MSRAPDKSAWGDHAAGRAPDNEACAALVNGLGGAPDRVDAPDIVAGGQRPLRLSLVWLAPLLDWPRMVPVQAQDGVGQADLVSPDAAA